MNCIRPATASVAIISNDALLARRVASILDDVGCQVDEPTAHASDDLPTFAARPDVIVLDRRGCGSVERQIRRLRRRWPTVGIVVLYAGSQAEIAALLEVGADDAIGGGSRILSAHLHAVARRARTVNAGARIAMGDVVFDRESRRVWCAGREVKLTRREQALLDCLFWYAPEPVGAQTLSDFVWGNEPVNSRRALVEVYVGYVRRKLSTSRSVAIRTIRGVGYRFEPLIPPSP